MTKHPKMQRKLGFGSLRGIQSGRLKTGGGVVCEMGKVGQRGCPIFIGRLWWMILNE